MANTQRLALAPIAQPTADQAQHQALTHRLETACTQQRPPAVLRDLIDELLARLRRRLADNQLAHAAVATTEVEASGTTNLSTLFG